ncbi:DUF2188 domain-containing protein [Polynucleobacter difficilis]|uniref:DUF2188 domain-containing protein n=1 Tax=Polynucleobacter difficilis TaxID=556054 RepID=UPI000D3740A9|nr:DUF2188 domain-containing protein [Polynucleobacter difficilis]
MANLKKYEVGYDRKAENWKLKEQGSSKVIAESGIKAGLVTGGKLAQLLRGEGGSVRIKKMDNKIQEERTYPRSKDPQKSKG